MNVGLVTIVLVFAIPIVAILMAPFIILAESIGERLSGKHGKKGSKAVLGRDEREVVQEVYQCLARMAERIEAIETILLSDESTPGKSREEMKTQGAQR